MNTNLKKIRTDAGLSQETLAEKSGISRAIISALENGRLDNVTVKTMTAIAKALGVKVSEIFLLV